VVVVAEDLVPGDGPIEPGGLEGPLVVDRVGAEVCAGAGPDHLAVQDVEVPPQLVVLGAVAHVAQGEAEVEAVPLVEDVDRLDGSVEELRREQHRRRERVGEAAPVAIVECVGR